MHGDLNIKFGHMNVELIQSCGCDCRIQSIFGLCGSNLSKLGPTSFEHQDFWVVSVELDGSCLIYKCWTWDIADLGVTVSLTGWLLRWIRFVKLGPSKSCHCLDTCLAFVIVYNRCARPHSSWLRRCSTNLKQFYKTECEMPLVRICIGSISFLHYIACSTMVAWRIWQMHSENLFARSTIQ